MSLSVKMKRSLWCWLAIVASHGGGAVSVCGDVVYCVEAGYGDLCLSGEVVAGALAVEQFFGYVGCGEFWRGAEE